MGFSTRGGFLFGSVFVAVGIAIILMGTKVLAVDPASVHAPYWVLTVVGASFALGGLMVWGMAWKQFAANRQRTEAARQHPNEPALADYPWHPGGFEVSEWTNAAKALGVAVGLSIFLSIFNWWGFAAGGPMMVKAIVILFDVIALLMWGKAGQLLGRALKFGHSQIKFTRFPYRLTDPIVLRWQPAGGIIRIKKGTFTLRCVEEWMERRGSGENQNLSLVQEEIWSGKWILDQPRNFPLKDTIELSYEVPADAQPTQLNNDKPVFWELEVKLDLPGFNFEETYLVPIYSSATAPDSKPVLANS